MSQAAAWAEIAQLRPKVVCPECRHVVFDGEAVLSRCVLVEAHGAKAKCKCKAWVRVPLRYAGGENA